MTRPALRVIHPEAQSDRRQKELDRIAGAADAKTVAVPLGKIVPLLMDACDHDRAWLRDFSNDLVRIDADLYDVLMAYQEMRRRVA
jgi:hypothetical protein